MEFKQESNSYRMRKIIKIQRIELENSKMEKTVNQPKQGWLFAIGKASALSKFISSALKIEEVVKRAFLRELGGSLLVEAIKN